MTKRTLTRLACLLALSAASAVMGQTTQAVGDAFSDGKCNTNLWTVPAWSEAKWKEDSGRLRLFSQPTNASLTQRGMWVSTFTTKCNEGDTLNVTAKVRVPHKITGSAEASFEAGFGLFGCLTGWDSVELTLRDSLSNRQFVVSYLSDLEPVQDCWTYAAPTDLAIVFLRMSYSAAADTVNFYWSNPKTPGNWIKIRPGLRLEPLFGPSLLRKMTPYAVGYADSLLLPSGWNVWLDDFQAVYLNQPAP